MGIKEKMAKKGLEEQLLALSDRELVDHILQFPDQIYLNYSDSGRRKYPVGDMAQIGARHMDKDESYRLSDKHRWALAHGYAECAVGTLKSLDASIQALADASRKGDIPVEPGRMVWFRMRPGDRGDMNDVNAGILKGVGADGMAEIAVYGVRKAGSVWVKAEDGSRIFRSSMRHVHGSEGALREALGREIAGLEPISWQIGRMSRMGMSRMDDRQFLEAILAFPDKRMLDYDEQGHMRRFPLARKARYFANSMDMGHSRGIDPQVKKHMANEFVHCREGLHPMDIGQAPRDRRIYKMTFGLNGFPGEGIEAYMNGRGWADALNRELSMRGIPDRVRNVTFLFPGGLVGAAVMGSDDWLDEEALHACGRFIIKEMDGLLSEDLKRHGHIYMNGAKPSFATKGSYFAKLSWNLKEDVMEKPSPMQRPNAGEVRRKRIWYRGEDGTIQRGYALSSDGLTVEVERVTRTGREITHMPAGDVCESREACQQLSYEKPDDFTKAVDSLGKAPAETPPFVL